MRTFLYRFGYCTPDQWAGQEAHGWDDETSGAFFVVAETEDSALAWGQEVSEALVHHLFQRAHWLGDVPSWKEARFASWIEQAPAVEFRDGELQELPTVYFGELPDLRTWV